MVDHKRFAVFLILLFVCFSAGAQGWGELFDDHWKFALGEQVGAAARSFDPRGWRSVELPHDWSIEGAPERSNPSRAAGGYFPTGVGWYRKEFTAPVSWKGKAISILFEGVYMNAEVFVNGRSLGVHPYGYSTFYYDISHFLDWGKRNVIAVRADNSQQVNCRWYSGSGIYRHVRITVKDPLHIDPWKVAVTTPEVSSDKAVVSVTAKVKNDPGLSGGAELSTVIEDERGEVVARDSVLLSLAGKVETSVARKIAVVRPMLWSVDSPHLYRVKMLLTRGGRRRDEYVSTLGIRTIDFSVENGFRLNGRAMKLYGGCIHHDNGVIGAVACDRAEERKVELLKAAGFNALRTSHNPPSIALLDACDRLGVLVIDEAFDGWREAKNANDYTRFFDAWWRRDLESMVLRDRNHPCVVIWSVGNEILERKSPGAIKTASELVAAVHQHDMTRPVTSAMTTWDKEWEMYDPLFAVQDIGGYNYQLFRAASDHLRVPSRIIVQTESYPRDVFVNWQTIRNSPYIIGDFVWTAMDYLGESGIGRNNYPGEPRGEFWQSEQYPWHGSYCGDLDLIGWRKPVSHYRSILNNGVEKLYMAVREPKPDTGSIQETIWSVWPTRESWTWPGREGKEMQVEVYSRYPKVRLYLNDALVGEQKCTEAEEYKATFTLPYSPGKLKAVGGDDSVVLRTAGEPRAILLSADRKRLKADGQGLSYVAVELVDKDGVVDPNADNRLVFTVEGPATLAGAGSGDMKDTDKYVGNTRKAWHGRALVVLRSTHEAGEIKLTVSSEGLKKGVVVLNSGGGELGGQEQSLRERIGGQPLRGRINFNRDWKFRLGDHPGAEEPDYDDGGWEPVGLPHSFSTPYFGASQFYTGWGWYRKHFTLSGDGPGRRWWLEFEAAFQDAEVFVNGVRVGGHQGGYTGFSLDITSAVKAGDNVVAVRLNNLWNPRLAPRAGEHTFSGGIYRDVYLVATGPVHVGWCGAFVTTPEVSERAARVRVQTEVVNGLDSSCSVEANTVVRDAQGVVVARWVLKQRVGRGATGLIDQSGLLQARPHLWSPNNPYRYRATTALWVGGRKVDEYTTAFGIRSIRWRAESGFFLNGKHLYLCGANVHQDHAGWGDAVTNAGFYRDVRLMKDAGFNFIRGSHYPHDPAFYDACDSLGMLCWSENTFWGIGGSDNTPEGYWNASAYPTIAGDQTAFEESVERELREMIRIQRNHPCVIVWSMSNEPFFTATSVLQQTRQLLKKLVGIAHVCDPTRPAAIGGAQRPLDSNRIDLLGDVAGYNGDGGAIPLFHDPGIPNVVTEYGSLVSKRPGEYVPNWGDLSGDSGKAVYAWRAGQAIWCGFDHGSIAGPQMGEMGLVDYFRIPKRAWYWYRDHYRHIPPPVWPREGVAAGLRLSADKRRANADGTDDIRLLVTVVDARGVPISNSPPVDLTIESGPGELPTGLRLHFAPGSDIAILDGQAAIECRAWYAGRSRVRVSSPGLRPASLDVDFDGPVAYVPGLTRPEASRSYVRFAAGQPDTVARSFGRNNPTFASSAAEGHSSGFAADGDSLTFWRPLTGDSAIWWSVDMEKQVKVGRIVIDFGRAGPSRYIVEVGGKEGWRTVYAGNGQGAIKVIEVPGVAGKEVRIRWPSPAEARLSEVKVVGVILP